MRQFKNELNCARKLDTENSRKGDRERFHIPEKNGKPLTYLPAILWG